MGQNDDTNPLAEAERLALARAALREFHAQCLWFWREDLEVKPADIPDIVRGLRRDGGRWGSLLAARLCR